MTLWLQRRAVTVQHYTRYSASSFHDFWLNPLPCATFYSIQLVGGGESVGHSPAVRPLMVLKLHGKNERVARNERKPMVFNFMVLGQPVTLEVRSNTQI